MGVRCNVCKNMIAKKRVKLNGKYYHPSCAFVKAMNNNRRKRK